MDQTNKHTKRNWLLIIIICIAAGFFFTYSSNENMPTVTEITPPLIQFLTENQNDCDEVSIQLLKNINVGSYVKEPRLQVEGFPVFAESEVTCSKTTNTSGYPSRISKTFKTTAEKNPVAYAKKVNGKWTLYVPDLFRVGR